MTLVAEATSLSFLDPTNPWANSRAMVEGIVSEQREIVQVAKRLGICPTMAVVHTGPNGSIKSYAEQLREHGKDIGARVWEFRPESEDEALDLIKRLNDDPAIHGILPLFPSFTPDGEMTMRAAMTNPYKDIDRVSSVIPVEKQRFVPATPVSMKLLAAHYLGQKVETLLPDEVAVIGNGKLVGGPLLEGMSQQGFVPATVLRSNQEVQTWPKALAKKVEEARLRKLVVFSAIPVANMVDAAQLPPVPTLWIDAGFGQIAGTEKRPAYAGNVNASTVAVGGLLRVSPFKHGVGPGTTGVMWGNLLSTAIDQELERILNPRQQAAARNLGKLVTTHSLALAA